MTLARERPGVTLRCERETLPSCKAWPSAECCHVVPMADFIPWSCGAFSARPGRPHRRAVPVERMETALGLYRVCFTLLVIYSASAVRLTRNLRCDQSNIS